MTKRVRVALIGSGVLGDAYRVTLPTYTLVDLDTGAMTAVIDVPDDVYPPAPVGKPETVTLDAKYGSVITVVDPAHKVSAAAFFDDKYREHKGKFSLDVK
jgi:hypothetical protein